jgi:hypothetical protein
MWINLEKGINPIKTKAEAACIFINRGIAAIEAIFGLKYKIEYKYGTKEEAYQPVPHL